MFYHIDIYIIFKVSITLTISSVWVLYNKRMIYVCAFFFSDLALIPGNAIVLCNSGVGAW